MSDLGQELTRKQESAVEALLSEPTHEAAAQKTGISPATLRRWLLLPHFKAAYQGARRQLVEAAVGRLQKATGQAVRTLRKAMKCGDNPGVQVRAAQLVLEFAFRGGDLLDLSRRVEELERQQTEGDDGAKPSSKPDPGNEGPPAGGADSGPQDDQPPGAGPAAHGPGHADAGRGNGARSVAGTGALSTAQRTLLLCARQAGKSTVAAGLAVAEALTRPRSLVLLLSPSERQSGELAAKVFGYYDALGEPVPCRRRTELQLHLVNGSRIIALPENEKTVRGYSGARLLIVDEASRVSDALYRAVRPMLAVSRGRLLALSTPFGKRGWFFEEWHGAGTWERVRITALECPRIPADFLEEERLALGERWYNQEYLCSFEDAIDTVFSYGDISAALSEDAAPLIVTGG